jgi:Flp pilus assembly protein TadG
MVEFAMALPLILLVLFGMIDFGRYSQVSNTVSEAARQGARQLVPNAQAADNPFTGPPNGSCSGQVFTANQSITTQGCLTDAAVLATVAGAMSGVLRQADITLQQDTDANGCKTLASVTPPAVGKAYLCISPKDTGTTTVHTTACPASYPAPTPAPLPLTRQQEWSPSSTHALKGCYYVTVTIVYAYKPWTPLISQLMGTRLVTSSTSMLAEY